MNKKIIIILISIASHYGFAGFISISTHPSLRIVQYIKKQINNPYTQVEWLYQPGHNLGFGQTWWGKKPIVYITQEMHDQIDLILAQGIQNRNDLFNKQRFDAQLAHEAGHFIYDTPEKTRHEKEFQADLHAVQTGHAEGLLAAIAEETLELSKIPGIDPIAAFHYATKTHPSFFDRVNAIKNEQQRMKTRLFLPAAKQALDNKSLPY